MTDPPHPNQPDRQTPADEETTEGAPPCRCESACAAHNISIIVEGVTWEIELDDAVERWFLELCEADPESADLVEQAIEALAEHGPTLSRPLADRIKGSYLHNLKELRPASAGRSEVRILFAFDPRRSAILLVAGDKAGQWQRWYEEAILLAEKRYEQHLVRIGGR